MHRRSYLGTIGAATTVALAGCGVLGDDGDDGPGDPQDRVEALVEQSETGDHEAVNEMIAEDGEMDEWTAEDAGLVSAYDWEITNLETVEESDDQAKVAVTVRVTEDDSLIEAFTRTYELRVVDGEWMFWDSDAEE